MLRHDAPDDPFTTVPVGQFVAGLQSAANRHGNANLFADTVRELVARVSDEVLHLGDRSTLTGRQAERPIAHPLDLRRSARPPRCLGHQHIPSPNYRTLGHHTVGRKVHCVSLG